MGEDSEALRIGLCRGCLGDLTVDRDQPRCQFCGMPKPGWRQPRCPRCSRRRFAFQQVVSLGDYRGGLRNATIRMKKFREFPLTAAVARLLADELARPDCLANATIPEVIVPIPKFWVKRVLRGANSSELLAEVIGCKLRLPVTHAALRCRRNTSKQSLLGVEARRRNVQGAFQLVRGYDFRGADVLLVDDIMTTGATASDAARALCRGGAKRIVVAVVARAIVGTAENFDNHQEGLQVPGNEGQLTGRNKMPHKYSNLVGKMP